MISYKCVSKMQRYVTAQLVLILRNPFVSSSLLLLVLIMLTARTYSYILLTTINNISPVRIILYRSYLLLTARTYFLLQLVLILARRLSQAASTLLLPIYILPYYYSRLLPSTARTYSLLPLILILLLQVLFTIATIRTYSSYNLDLPQLDFEKGRRIIKTYISYRVRVSRYRSRQIV